MGADLEASMPVSDPQNKDGVCYFPRDLSRGKYGGDVFCLQKFLKKKVRRRRNEQQPNEWRCVNEPQLNGDASSRERFPRKCILASRDSWRKNPPVTTPQKPKKPSQSGR